VSSLNTGTPLDIAYQFVRELPEDINAQNRYHAVFLRTIFHIPCLKTDESAIDYTPLRLYHEDKAFFVAFDHPERLMNWAQESSSQEIGVRTLNGEELIQSLAPFVYLVLNPGTPYYTEIGPEQINYLKKTINVIEKELISNS